MVHLFMQARLRVQSLCKRPRSGQVAWRTTSCFPAGFTLFPDFFSAHEQRILLSSALDQLDSRESKHIRKLQKQYRQQRPKYSDCAMEDLFLPERYYTFHKVR